MTCPNCSEWLPNSKCLTSCYKNQLHEEILGAYKSLDTCPDFHTNRAHAEGLLHRGCCGVILPRPFHMAAESKTEQSFGRDVWTFHELLSMLKSWKKQILKHNNNNQTVLIGSLAQSFSVCLFFTCVKLATLLSVLLWCSAHSPVIGCTDAVF